MIAAIRTHNRWTVPFFKNFSRPQGILSSFICFARSPRTLRSTHMKSSVHTVCGQAYPHHRRPARAVKKKSE